MEMNNGSEHRTTETYMMPVISSNPHLISTPTLQEIDNMSSEVPAEFIIDQGLYYPAAANYYGYYCTGFESPGEWDDHNTVFGLDGQDLQYPGLQTESLPYVYYSPSYGYAQSPFNPYNPYIPGAVVGVDGSFIGTQQYFANPAYPQPVSSPAYIPVVVQPGSDIIPNSSPDLSLFNTTASSASRPASAGIKYTPQPASVGTAATSQWAASRNLSLEPLQATGHRNHSSSKFADGSQINVAINKHPASHGGVTSGSFPHVNQGRSSPGLAQPSDQFSVTSMPSLRNPVKVTLPAQNGFADIGSNVRGWATAEKFRPRLQLGGTLKYGNGNPDVLGEQNRGPRTSRSKSQWPSSIVVKAYSTKAGASNAQGNIVICADQFNREDFPVNYPNAKFFVIKSYSEDDVHKSIKYNLWSSTPNGNKRLDYAYEDARKISGGNTRNCPIFLFFSVNASGQFCGVAEMIGPVDFQKDMDFWQQDKWTGSFPVKWHIVKDVPNSSFRHIILENNENKPVTNSRDTQEIRFIPGMNMLNIFKSSPLKTSVLDDFMYYEGRQRIMHEEKSRLLGMNFDSTPYFPVFVPPSKQSIRVSQPQKADENTSEPNGPSSVGKVESADEQATSNHNNVGGVSNGKNDGEPNLAQDASSVSLVMKIGTLSIDPKESDSNKSGHLKASTAPDDVVTVGSMPIKVNGFAESSSGILTVGTIDIDPKAVQKSNGSVNTPRYNT